MYVDPDPPVEAAAIPEVPVIAVANLAPNAQVNAIAKTVHPDLEVKQAANGDHVATMLGSPPHHIPGEMVVKQEWKKIGDEFHGLLTKLGHKPKAEIQ